MKIELLCSDCQSTIRVDAIHAGKQVRCPVCSCISQVPVSGEVIEPVSEGESVEVGGEEEVKPRPKSPPAIRDSVFDRPPVPGLPDRVVERRSAIDQRFTLAIVWGLAAIISNFFCCGSYVAAVFALVGLGNGLFSKSSLRQSGIVINLVALAISGFMIAARYLFMG